MANLNCGVYEIRNKNNGHRYIGSSINLQYRLGRHNRLLRHNKHFNPHLQNAWNKYGTSNFMFDILLYCDEKNVRLFEQMALDGLKPEYNIAPGVVIQGYKLAEETKRKISKANKGRVFSEESKMKMSEAQKGRIPWNKNKTGVYSDEVRRKMSQSQSGKILSWETKRKISKTLKEYKHTNEHNKNVSIAKTGKRRKPFTIEHRRKLSEAGMGNTNGLGHAHTEEHKRKISVGVKNYYLNKGKNNA